jgi:hypothetical protein
MDAKRFPDAVQRSYAAPQIRDPGFYRQQPGPRISSAPRCKRSALRSIRGTPNDGIGVKKESVV